MEDKPVQTYHGQQQGYSGPEQVGFAPPGAYSNQPPMAPGSGYGQHMDYPSQPPMSYSNQPQMMPAYNSTYMVEGPNTMLYIVLSALSGIFCCWCTGAVAFFLSILAHNAKNQGDTHTAFSYVRSARIFIIVTVVLGCAALFTFFLFNILGGISASSTA